MLTKNAGIDIIRAALRKPCRQIVENAGVEGSIVIGKLLRAKKIITLDLMLKLKLTLILVKSGIIDPVKVVRTALENASSIAGFVINN